MKVGSLFSGIGGFDLGFERAGFEIAWCVEKDRHAQKVLEARFPRAKIHDDICTVDSKDLCEVDVICGGFPCQDLSVAGKRAGLAGARSGLFHEAMRIVRAVRPRLLVLENVPGLLSSNNGLDFATVIREVGEGWDCSEVGWRVLDSQYFGVAQRRKRCFIVAGSATGCAEEVLALAQGGGWDPPSCREARKAVASNAASGVGVGEWWDGSETAQTLTKSNANGSQSMPDKGNFGALVQVVGALTAKGPQSLGAPEVDANHYIPIAIKTGDSEKARSDGPAVERSPILDTTGFQSVFTIDMQACKGNANIGIDVSPTLCRPSGNDSHAMAYFDGASEKTLLTVRRLTPVECERLQGFPDGWTNIGTPEKPTADSQRYKQLGNAVTVNVAEWLARRAFRTLTCAHAT